MAVKKRKLTWDEKVALRKEEDAKEAERIANKRSARRAAMDKLHNDRRYFAERLKVYKAQMEALYGKSAMERFAEQLKNYEPPAGLVQPPTALPDGYSFEQLITELQRLSQSKGKQA